MHVVGRCREASGGHVRTTPSGRKRWGQSPNRGRKGTTVEMGASSEEGGGPDPAKRPVGLFKSQLKSRRARGGRGLAGKAKAEAELERSENGNGNGDGRV